MQSIFWAYLNFFFAFLFLKRFLFTLCSLVMGGMYEERNVRKERDVENSCKYFKLYFNHCLPRKISRYEKVLFFF